MRFGIPGEAHPQQAAKQLGYYDTKKKKKHVFCNAEIMFIQAYCSKTQC